MALTGNAQRALDQVKMGLYMLYGANYFTEEEWIKIDGLIHKGKYEFTRGPPSNILEEPLMSFEESTTETKDGVQTPETRPSNQTTELNTAVTAEEQISSASSEQADSILSAAESSNETPLETPIENSYHDSAVQKPYTTESALPSTSGYDENTVATSQPFQPNPQPETNNGLPAGYTQEQIDEVRAFNAGLTKAGQKSRPKYDPVEEYPASEWEDDFAQTIPQDQSFSPAPSDQEERINTWAGEVTQEPSPSPGPQIQSPTPNPIPTRPAVEALAEQFMKTHGRPPKSLNDFYQPNNPAHHLARPSSRTSVRTTKTTKSIKSPAQLAVERIASGSHSIALGKVYTAQSGAPPKGIRIEIHAGDHIRVTKYVSGIMYIGENLRTRQHGQFPETIFMKGPSAVAVEAPAPAAFQRGLDRVENVNAAEWDDVSSTRKQAGTPAPRPYIGGGLAASRFSVLADREPVQTPPAPRQKTVPDMEGKIGQIINDKVDEILKARGMAPASHTPPKSSPKAAPKGVQPIKPKTETCWFWAVKNDCRFTAEECRDLHAYLPNRTGTPTNLRMGKPTWGALADYLPAATSTEEPAASSPSLSNSDAELKAKGKSCYYWAREGSCTQSAESCKYLHGYSPLGVAPKPPGARNQWKKQWGELQARYDAGNGSGSGSANGEGELILEEVSEVELDGWGQPIKKPAENTWGSTGSAGSASGKDTKYKPPHVQAMEAIEEQLSREAAGW